MSIKNWYPFYPMDFLRDTELLTLDERSLYREMLDIYWINEGKLDEKDAKNLAKKRGFTSQKFDKNWKKICEFFPISKGSLSNRRMDEELDKARSKHDKAVANGKVGGVANASKNKGQKPDSKSTSPPPPPPSQQQIGSPPPNGGAFTYRLEEENADVVFSRPMEWVEHFVNTYGYAQHEAQTDKTIPTFSTWCDAKIAVGEAYTAMQIAWRSAGGLPDSPNYIDKILRRLRGAEQNLRQQGAMPQKTDNARLADELKAELEAEMQEAANAN